jgi:hypothetical protein
MYVCVNVYLLSRMFTGAYAPTPRNGTPPGAQRVRAYCNMLIDAGDNDEEEENDEKNSAEDSGIRLLCKGAHSFAVDNHDRGD